MTAQNFVPLSISNICDAGLTVTVLSQSAPVPQSVVNVPGTGTTGSTSSTRIALYTDTVLQLSYPDKTPVQFQGNKAEGVSSMSCSNGADCTQLQYSFRDGQASLVVRCLIPGYIDVDVSVQYQDLHKTQVFLVPLHDDEIPWDRDFDQQLGAWDMGFAPQKFSTFKWSTLMFVVDGQYTARLRVDPHILNMPPLYLGTPAHTTAIITSDLISTNGSEDKGKLTVKVTYQPEGDWIPLTITNVGYQDANGYNMGMLVTVDQRSHAIVPTAWQPYTGDFQDKPTASFPVAYGYPYNFVAYPDTKLTIQLFTGTLEAVNLANNGQPYNGLVDFSAVFNMTTSKFGVTPVSKNMYSPPIGSLIYFQVTDIRNPGSTTSITVPNQTRARGITLSNMLQACAFQNLLGSGVYNPVTKTTELSGKPSAAANFTSLAFSLAYDWNPNVQSVGEAPTYTQALAPYEQVLFPCTVRRDDVTNTSYAFQPFNITATLGYKNEQEVSVLDTTLPVGMGLTVQSVDYPTLKPALATLSTSYTNLAKFGTTPKVAGVVTLQGNGEWNATSPGVPPNQKGYVLLELTNSSVVGVASVSATQSQQPEYTSWDQFALQNCPTADKKAQPPYVSTFQIADKGATYQYGAFSSLEDSPMTQFTVTVPTGAPFSWNLKDSQLTQFYVDKTIVYAAAKLTTTKSVDRTQHDRALYEVCVPPYVTRILSDFKPYFVPNTGTYTSKRSAGQPVYNATLTSLKAGKANKNADTFTVPGALFSVSNDGSLDLSWTFSMSVTHPDSSVTQLTSVQFQLLTPTQSWTLFDPAGVPWFTVALENALGKGQMNLRLAPYEDEKQVLLLPRLENTPVYYNVPASPIIPGATFVIQNVNNAAVYDDVRFPQGSTQNLNGVGVNMYMPSPREVTTFGGKDDVVQALAGPDLGSDQFTFATCMNADGSEKWYCLKSVKYGFIRAAPDVSGGYYPYVDLSLGAVFNHMYADPTLYDASGVPANAAVAPRWSAVWSANYNWAVPTKSRVTFLYQDGPGQPVQAVDSGSLRFTNGVLDITSKCTGIMKTWRGSVSLRRTWLPYGPAFAQAGPDKDTVQTCTASLTDVPPPVPPPVTLSFTNFSPEILGEQQVKLTAYYKTSFVLTVVLASSSNPRPDCAATKVMATMPWYGTVSCPLDKYQKPAACLLQDTAAGAITCGSVLAGAGVGDKQSRLPSWAIALIVLGCLVVVGVVVVVVFLKSGKQLKTRA